MFLRSLSLLSALPFLAVSALGTPASSSALSLDDVLARVASRHPELLARRHREEAATARIEQAGLKPDPELEFTLENALGTGAFRGVRGVEATVVANQTIERGGKRERRTDLATRFREVEIAASEVLLAELSANAVAAYVGVVLAKERAALADENLALAREMLAATERLQADGTASASELARARVAVAAAAVDVRRAEAGALRARTALAAAWGGRAEDVATVTGSLRSPSSAPTEAQLQPGLANHPRLAWHAARIAREEASVALAHTASTADLTAAAGVRYVREGSDAGFVAGLSVPLPNRTRTRREVRAAQADLAGAEQDLRAAETALQAELARACQDLAGARLTLDLLREQALPAAEQARAEARRAHAEGFLPLIDVIESQRTLLSVRRDMLDAQSAFATALAAAESLADRTYRRTRALLSLP